LLEDVVKPTCFSTEWESRVTGAYARDVTYQRGHAHMALPGTRSNFMKVSSMSKRLSVYLDTSVFSAYYDERNMERMLFTRDFWEMLGEYSLYTSDLTLEELSAHPDPQNKELLLQLTSSFQILDSKAANNIASEYMKYGIFPRGKEADALHVAVASSYGINILMSWNFTHIVKRKTRRMIAMVNSLLDYPIPEIISPFEF